MVIIFNIHLCRPQYIPFLAIILHWVRSLFKNWHLMLDFFLHLRRRFILMNSFIVMSPFFWLTDVLTAERFFKVVVPPAEYGMLWSTSQRPRPVLRFLKVSNLPVIEHLPPLFLNTLLVSLLLADLFEFEVLVFLVGIFWWEKWMNSEYNSRLINKCTKFQQYLYQIVQNN